MRLCKFFAEGHCERASDCWFMHDGASVTPTKEFKCGPCDTVFEDLTYLHVTCEFLSWH